MARKLANVDRRQRCRDVTRDAVLERRLRRRRSPDDDLRARVEHWREEHEALDVVQVQVRQEDVQRLLTGAVEREPEAADSGAGVEDERGAVVERDLHARRVAAVVGRLGTGGGDRATRTPDRQLQEPSSCVTQKSTIAPWKPSAPMTGMPLTSTRCSLPVWERIR